MVGLSQGVATRRCRGEKEQRENAGIHEGLHFVEAMVASGLAEILGRATRAPVAPDE
jgi:hypothetical protein